METEKIPMGQKQLQRWHLMEMVEGRKITLKEAGEKGIVKSCKEGSFFEVVKKAGLIQLF